MFGKLLRPSKCQQRGVSVPELLIVILLSSLLLTAAFKLYNGEQRGFFRRLTTMEASQSGRAALDILKINLRRAGFGLLKHTASMNYGSQRPIGNCFLGDEQNNQLAVNTNLCNDLPVSELQAGDRLRLFAARPETVRARPLSVTFNPNSSDTEVTFTTTTPITQLNTGINQDNLVLISKQQGNRALSDICILRQITSNAAETTYTLKPVPFSNRSDLSSGLNTTSNCTASMLLANGRQADLMLAAVVVTDFYVRNFSPDPLSSLPKIPALLMREYSIQAGQVSAKELVVANNIENLQVQYGIDVGDAFGNKTMDGGVDCWCDYLPTPLTNDYTCFRDGDIHQANPRPSPGCLGDLDFNQDIYQRIIAVRLALIVRTSNYFAEEDFSRYPRLVDPGLVKGFTLFNRNFQQQGDGFRRIIYRATVALRNNL